MSSIRTAVSIFEATMRKNEELGCSDKSYISVFAKQFPSASHYGKSRGRFGSTEIQSDASSSVGQQHPFESQMGSEISVPDTTESSYSIDCSDNSFDLAIFMPVQVRSIAIDRG
jgi:hypothetical protein